jgi:hypothetical protein
MNISIARNRGVLTILWALGLIAATPGASFAQLFQRWCVPCVPCPTAPAGEAGAPAVSGSGAQPGAAATETPSAETAAPSELFAQAGAGAASGPGSIAPNMVGDYLGGFVTMQIGASGGRTTPLPLPGGAIPRFKMAEDTSPMPVDRGYFIYDYYSNVPLNSPSISLNAFTPGFEKTFLDGAMSVEVRLPMATTLDNTIFLNGSTHTAEGEIGNLGVSVKALLFYSDTVAISGGLGIDCPTARDSLCFLNQDDPAGIQILNQSVHLLPFFGGIWTPNDRLFCLGFIQMDIDANGDSVNNVFQGSQGNQLTSAGNAGRYYEQTMLYLDGVAGYWVRRNDADRWINGIALFGELHGNQSLNNSPALSTQIGTMTGGNISILDMTVGADLQFGPLTTVTAAYCTPLTAQREFDGQLRLMFNRRF